MLDHLLHHISHHPATARSTAFHLPAPHTAHHLHPLAHTLHVFLHKFLTLLRVFSLVNLLHLSLHLLHPLLHLVHSFVRVRAGLTLGYRRLAFFISIRMMLIHRKRGGREHPN